MWTKKEMCEMTMTTPDALRFYEKKGLITPSRLNNNYRVYSQTEYRQIQYIKVLQYMGFSIAEIQALLTLDLVDPSDECDTSIIQMFSQKINEFEYKIDIYSKVLIILKDFMSERSEFMEFNKAGIKDFNDKSVEKIFQFLMDKDFK